jgi:hypothetical protein
MSDLEDLIASLSRSLEPQDRDPFRRAADDAVARDAGPWRALPAVELA